MFSNCNNNDFPLFEELILKKFELLLECQFHLIQNLKRKFFFNFNKFFYLELQEYTLPNLSHLLPSTIKVKYKEKSDITKIKRQVQSIKTIPSINVIQINNDEKLNNLKINKKIKIENNNESDLNNVFFVKKNYYIY